MFTKKLFKDIKSDTIDAMYIGIDNDRCDCDQEVWRVAIITR
jgi:hypothetical protein